ncbi:MAG: hypothetical protein LBQ91_03580 [Oscillospiraceae bacterium]|jgi:LuxR family maltose regulon positive regulatory protein|nr:hypothetical protein [Oscillospiraceae bacterium]
MSSVPSIHKRTSFLERSRINQILTEAIESPIVVLCAGGGYGKTHAVDVFLKQNSSVSVWVQLSELDNMTLHFWENYVHTLEGLDGELAQALQALGFPDNENKFAAYAELIEKSFSGGKKFVLVLDDFHFINDSALLDFLERMIKSFAAIQTVFFLSRTPPERKLMRLFASVDVVSIEEDALCFTRDEIAEYFSKAGIQADHKSIESVYNDTKGLAFAVNIVGRSLKRHSEYRGYAGSAFKLSMFRLIEEELFLTISEKLQHFLIRLSLINHLSADLVRILAEDDALIQEMELLHAYIRYDIYSNAYLIHHLLLDYLAEKQEILTPLERYETFARAAVWCDKNGFKVDAMIYYGNIENYEAISIIIYGFYMQIPPDIAARMLDIFDGAPDTTAMKTAVFPVMHLRLKMSAGQLRESWELARRYEKMFLKMPEGMAKARKLSYLYAAFAIMRQLFAVKDGKYDFARYFQKCYDYYLKSPYTVAGPSKSHPVCSWAVWVGSEKEGEIEDCIKELSASISPAMNAMDGFMYGLDDLAYGELRFFQNDFKSAAVHFAAALEKAQELNQYDIYFHTLFYMMRIAFAHGDLSEADRCLKKMEENLSQENYPISGIAYDLALAFYYQKLGQTDLIPKSMQGDFIPCAYGTFFENIINHTKMHTLYALRQYSAILDFIRGQQESELVIYGKIEIKIFEAVCNYLLKNRPAALDALTEAYALASPNRLSMPFIEFGKDMRALTAFALQSGSTSIPNEWLEEIRQKSAAYAKHKSHIISEG